MKKLKTAIISGVIVLIIGTFIIDPAKNFFFPEKVQSQPTTRTVPVLPKDIKPSSTDTAAQSISKKFLIQSYSTREVFGGDLNITLNDMVEYANQKIHLVVGVTGKPQQNFKQMSLGDKVIYEGYEITFIDTQSNISTRDVWLKVVPINKKI